MNGYQFDPEGLTLTEPQIEMLEKAFSNQEYRDVPGLCKVTDREEIESQGWSLNPGRYVGVAERSADDFDFAKQLKELNDELEELNCKAQDLESTIRSNVEKVLRESIADES